MPLLLLPLLLLLLLLALLQSFVKGGVGPSVAVGRLPLSTEDRFTLPLARDLQNLTHPNLP